MRWILMMCRRSSPAASCLQIVGQCLNRVLCSLEGAVGAEKPGGSTVSGNVWAKALTASRTKRAEGALDCVSRMELSA